MFDKVVWAADGSARDEQSLPVVREICARHSSSLRIVHVVQQLPGPLLPGRDVHGGEDRLVAKLKARTTALRGRGINASLHVVRGAVGHTADHIAAVAMAGDAQLIIAGGRSRSPWEGALLGSVTQRLPAVAPCPVLVLPTPQPDRGAAASARPRITAWSAAPLEDVSAFSGSRRPASARRPGR